ncbi:hypothetical protein HIM_01483 [Hirsutella minnesotensis 3608]|nr:hypothetical protein HIM_01483 [Hirsutella minnesotensis 3608]
MTSSLASEGRPSLPAPADAASDPFVAGNSPSAISKHRFTDFDTEPHTSTLAPSPAEAKRALEAHLAETDRRLDEAGKLGTALVSQRKALTEQLQEVERLQAEGQLDPDLRKKLVEIEREYNDVARESARVFLPKQRVPSNEANPGSPFVPEARSGRRSISPSKFESQATGSPSKLNVPNRRSRNQPSSRVHDIEFAAEISTSLIAQVRNLQGLLSERDEELKNLHTDRSRLEIETESLQQRLRTLDESEHRYKEENWNLETRLQELSSHHRESADREKRLNQALAFSDTEKSAVQKELDEVKLSHSKLAEEHASTVKHHDIELGTVKRTVVMAEGERAALQRKVDELTSQNQELAKAFSAQRGRTLDREPNAGMEDDDLDNARESLTPEHSPPPSPIKATPRHSMLETETVKTSLQHAQRTIQSQRNQLHREKTEKLELRRIIQDLREDLEKARNDAPGPSSNKRSRKVESKDMKKPPHLLGSFRSSRQEIVLDDPEWEDHPDMPPEAPSLLGPTGGNANRVEASDQFETANEASESAFETANERATETEDFQTGNEAYSDSDDTATETESPSRGFGRMRRPPSLPAGLVRRGSRGSFRSTASTSPDEEEPSELRTPTASQSQRSRARYNRGPMSRSSRQASEEPNMRSSPASFISGGTTRAGQSLFAELQDFGATDDESGVGTPSRRSMRSVTPGSIRRTMSPKPAVPQLPRVVMVDSGVMTEPVRISSTFLDEHSSRPVSMADSLGASDLATSVVWRDSRESEAVSSRPWSTISHSDAGAPDIGESLAQFPVPPMSSSNVRSPSLPELTYSPIQSLGLEPCPEPYTAPTLGLSSLSMEHVEPVLEVEVPPPELSLSTIFVQDLVPQQEPESPPPTLSMTPMLWEVVDPIASPLPDLSLSTIYMQGLEPIAEPAPIEAIVVSPPPTAMPELMMSSIMSETVEPVIPLQPTTPLAPRFAFTSIESIETRPMSPRSPRRDGFILPRDDDLFDVGSDSPSYNNEALGLGLGRGKARNFVPVIAEDETSQSLRDSLEVQTPESQRPFKEISSNATSSSRSPRKPQQMTSDQGAQTALTSSAIDELLSAPQQENTKAYPDAMGFVASPDTPGTVQIHRSPRNSFDTPVRGKSNGEPAQEAMPLGRRGSAASAKDSLKDAPPLPSNHREIIDAARSGSSRSQAGSMGPPLWPASAMNKRPQTPSQQRPGSSASTRASQTGRLARGGSTHGTAGVYSPKKLTAMSRKSSVSSFASELDTRFNMRPEEMGMVPQGFSPDTDPRMIQAITQTMIGEFLWKYTRKPGRGEISENRHRRYFWVHPYTRTLYWCDRDPSSAGRTELRAKSVPIEAVRVVGDDNPMPPGLHRKSLIIVSPGRTIKFTCTTGQRHETWFNALSYLLLRTNQDGQSDAEEMAENMTREDVEEFNPQLGRRPTNGQHSSNAPPSLSSYNSRGTRNEASGEGITMGIPTLVPNAHKHQHQQATSRTSAGTLSKLSGYWRAPKLSGTFSSLRVWTPANQPAEVYEASEVHDSAEDLREMIERQDREADRLENVRACCDGEGVEANLPIHIRDRPRPHQ